MELNLKLGGTGHIDGRHSFSRSFQVKKMKTFLCYWPGALSSSHHAQNYSPAIRYLI